jgi:hypothetical protein
MRTHRVIDLFPLPQFAIELFHLQRAGRDLIELLGVSPFGALDRAVEFGKAWREHEQVQATLLASLLELSGELRSAFDLQSADGKGHAVQQSIEKLGGGEGGGPSVGLDDVPARDPIAGGELLEDHAGQATQLQGIDLDEVTRTRNRVLPGFADGIGRGHQGAAAAADPAARRFDQLALPFQLSQDAAHHGGGNLPALLAQEDGELVLAQAGIALPQSQDAIGERGRPSGAGGGDEAGGSALLGCRGCGDQ